MDLEEQVCVRVLSPLYFRVEVNRGSADFRDNFLYESGHQNAIFPISPLLDRIFSGFLVGRFGGTDMCLD